MGTSTLRMIWGFLIDSIKMRLRIIIGNETTVQFLKIPHVAWPLIKECWFINNEFNCSSLLLSRMFNRNYYRLMGLKSFAVKWLVLPTLGMEITSPIYRNIVKLDSGLEYFAKPWNNFINKAYYYQILIRYIVISFSCGCSKKILMLN